MRSPFGRGKCAQKPRAMLEREFPAQGDETQYNSAALRLRYRYFIGQPPEALMVVSTSVIRRRVSISAAMMRG